ncbi:MAG: N-formylglutamate amidohydrolase [Ignavibacteria bacterium]|nr:N-formylglutamate amidohydrolase [Ignavibacteria bacterium]
MNTELWHLTEGNSPLIATAIHDGHTVREELKKIMLINEDEQLREEDPFTGELTEVAETRLIGLRSRFEVDLNRPRERAVYIKPEDAWNLNIYKTPPSQEIINRSLEEYDLFYAEVSRLFSDFEKRFGRFVVFDIHTYCYRRGGPDGVEADPDANPEVNIGTGPMDRDFWAPIVDRFITDMRAFNYSGSHLDVRENIKFKGGFFSKYTNEKFPNSACVLSIEFKKIFMDEWTGELFKDKFELLKEVLRTAVPGVLKELEKLNKKDNN